MLFYMQSAELRTWLKIYICICISFSLSFVSVFRTNIAVIIDSIASPLLKATIQLHCPATYVHMYIQTYGYSITKQQTQLQKAEQQTTLKRQQSVNCKLKSH